MQVSWARKKPQNHTTQKKKEKKIERNQEETKVKNEIVPVLVFLFSVFVFALLFSLFVFFIADTLETVFTTVGQQWFALFRWKSQTGIPKIRPLKISSHLTKLRQNHEIILVWKARQDRKYRVMRREKGKQKISVALFVFILSTLRIVFQRKNSAWPKKFKLLSGISSFLWKLLKVFVAHAVYDKYTQLK